MTELLWLPEKLNEKPDELHYYLFMISLDGRDESCNTLDNLCENIKCHFRALYG